jgi:hypothetical protein
MFIPRGKPVYENLATSYVLVDSLADDLSEGGFSGIVEVVLREVDCLIVFGRGAVLAATEGQLPASDRYSEDLDGQPELRGDTKLFVSSSVSRIAARSRNERGRLSIYACSLDAARSIADRLTAHTLYTRLSTEFADLDRMVTKLTRENEREWFVEVETLNGLAGLIHLKDETCHVFTSGPGEASLRDFLDKCGQAGATFDVHYKVGSNQEPAVSPTASAAAGTAPPAETAAGDEAPVEIAGQNASHDVAVDEAPAVFDSSIQPPVAAPASAESGSEPGDAAAVEEPPAVQPRRQDGSARAEDTGEAEAMAEIKRLMGEMASTIETAARSVETRDTFSMYLRAGQLKIADRYPFLDPFGNEFEYLGGEIVFVGAEKPEAFIAGVTEALKLAVTSIIETSSQSVRLRARIEEDMGQLMERLRPELEAFGLDQCIEQIIT